MHITMLNRPDSVAHRRCVGGEPVGQQRPERVGRIGRHTIVPPLTSLLDLARAAYGRHTDRLAIARVNPSRRVLGRR